MRKIENVKFDHVALKSSNIAESIDWYSNMFDCKVLYQDETWGLVEVSDLRIAFVIPSQHPPHVCFDIGDASHDLNEEKFKKHRDGSSSIYVRDPDGNFIEFLKWGKQND